MIVQAISLLDDLDKELNNYIMRCREWYGWHFPELGKIVTDNLAYAKTVKTMGRRIILSLSLKTAEKINCCCLYFRNYVKMPILLFVKVVEHVIRTSS